MKTMLLCAMVGVLSLASSPQATPISQKPRVVVIAKGNDALGEQIALDVRAKLAASPLFDFQQSDSNIPRWGSQDDWVVIIDSMDPLSDIGSLRGSETAVDYVILHIKASCSCLGASPQQLVVGGTHVHEVADQVIAKLDHAVSQ